MSEARRMAELYRSVYTGDDKGEAWHGPALKPLLKDVTAEQASRSRITGGHSILQLVLHLAYWEEIILRRFQGEIVAAPTEFSGRLALESQAHRFRLEGCPLSSREIAHRFIQIHRALLG